MFREATATGVRTVYFGDTAANVHALDARTGKEIWRVYYGAGYSVVPRPVYAHGPPEAMQS